MSSSVMKAIYERRSIRRYSDKPVDHEFIREILRAGSWAPSGLNNQPWRFAIVGNDELRSRIAELTRYGTIIKNAPVIIGVFLDREVSYDYVKDCQAVGACIQNMLLAAHELGLGAVWLGEILKNKDKIRDILGLKESLELMAVVAIGYPAHRNQSSERKSLEELIVFEDW